MVLLNWYPFCLGLKVINQWNVVLSFQLKSDRLAKITDEWNCLNRPIWRIILFHRLLCYNYPLSRSQNDNLINSCVLCVILKHPFKITMYPRGYLLGQTARWLELQPSSPWPWSTVTAVQYFRWCVLKNPAVCNFLDQIYSLSKEQLLWPITMLLWTPVFWLFGVKIFAVTMVAANGDDGCNWCSWRDDEVASQFWRVSSAYSSRNMFQICWNLAGIFFR